MNKLLDNLPSPPAIAIADLVRQLELSGEKIAKMQTGEPCFHTPAYIIEAAYNALRSNKTQYTSSQGIPELRNAISKWYAKDFGIKINTNNILVAHGAIGAIYCVISALFDQGDEAIIIDPAWPQYDNIVRMNQGVPKRVSTRNTDGKLIPDVLTKVINSKTKLIILNNPTNPTGIVYSKNEINEIITIAEEKNIYVMFDEVYNRITYSSEFSSVLRCEEYKNYSSKIIYVNSFSKIFAMTGWRIGYAFMDEQLIKKSLLVSQNIFTCISTFSQFAATKAIELMEENVSEYDTMIELYKKRHNELSCLLKQKNISFITPNGAFYFFIKIGGDSVRFAKELLENEKIAVVPGRSYGDDFDDYYRISFAVDNYSYGKFLDWLKSMR